MNGVKMIQVFISQPMNGVSDKQIQKTRAAAIQDVIAQAVEYYQCGVSDVEIMDTVIKDFDPCVHPLKYLGKSIEMIAEADAVYFVRGWQDARGCVIEHECAQKYGKHCMYY